MKKICAILALIVIFLMIFWFFQDRQGALKVIKLKSANEIYLDTDANGIADEDELVEMYYVRGFQFNSKTAFTSPTESTELSWLSYEYAQKYLLNKYVKAIYDKDNNLLTLRNADFDYAQDLAKAGLGVVNPSVRSNYQNYKEAVKEKLAEAKALKIVSYNPYSHKYHKLDCPFAYKSAGFKILPLSKIKGEAKPCKICHSESLKKNKEKKPEKYPRIEYEKYQPAYSDGYVELYLSDFTKYYYPSPKCVVTACQSLLNEINSARSTIDFAIYGISNQPELEDALKNAQKRGVKIRWVYDLDRNGDSIYSGTKEIAKYLKNSMPDIVNPQQSGVYSSSIMHNKFFIFDSKKVWTGSANISDTDGAGFNANAVLLINSAQIAKIYEKEFEQMYSGLFHKNKKPLMNESLALADSKIKVYFSPADKTIENTIIPLVKNSKSYIYMPVFVITHKPLAKELIEAKKRGVDVKIILDATGAANRYAPVKELRDSKILVKTENRAGKMHMKSILIDDRYTVIGSMNFSKSGENYNDENVLVIENPKLTQAYKKYFLYIFNAIPDKWLNKNPRAESYQSINSCYDGVDNDHDGKIDMEDDSCRFKVNKQR